MAAFAPELSSETEFLTVVASYSSKISLTMSFNRSVIATCQFSKLVIIDDQSGGKGQEHFASYENALPGVSIVTKNHSQAII
jgi:hypothetical protein